VSGYDLVLNRSRLSARHLARKPIKMRMRAANSTAVGIVVNLTSKRATIWFSVSSIEGQSQPHQRARSQQQHAQRLTACLARASERAISTET